MRVFLSWPGGRDSIIFGLSGVVGPLLKGTGLWLSTVVAPAKETLYSEFYLLLVFSVVPLLLAVAAGLMGWVYRRDLRQRQRPVPAAEPQPDAIEPRCNGSQLRLIPADASSDLGPAAAQVLKDARDVTTRVRFAYLVAALAYAALLTAFLLQAAAPKLHIAVLIMSYLILAPQIVVVTWFLRISVRQRLSIFLG